MVPRARIVLGQEWPYNKYPCGTLLHCWWECKSVQPLWRTVWRFLGKLKTELPNHPAIPLLGIYLEKTLIRKDTCNPMFTLALFTITKTWKQPRCPLTVEWVEKWYMHIYNGILLSHKKNEIMPFAATWMDRENTNIVYCLFVSFLVGFTLWTMLHDMILYV